MKLTISSTVLLAHLNLLLPVVPKRTTLPALQGILFVATAPLVLRATHLDNDISLVDETANIIEKGVVCIPANLLADFVSLVPKDSELTIESLDDQNRVRVSTNTKQKVSLAIYDPLDFPVTPTIENPTTLEMDTQALAKAISKAIVCASADDSRPILKAVALSVNGKTASFLGADGFRLAVANGISLSTKAKTAIYPIARETAELVLKVSRGREGMVKILVNESKIQFAWDDLTLTGSLVEGNYPNFDAVLPKEYETTLTFSADILKQSASLSSLFLTENTKTKLTIFNPSAEGIIISSAKNQDGDFNAPIPCEIKGNDPSPFALAGQFVSDFLGVSASKNVNIKMNTPNTPFLLEPTDHSDFFMLLMPVHIDNN